MPVVTLARVGHGALPPPATAAAFVGLVTTGRGEEVPDAPLPVALVRALRVLIHLDEVAGGSGVGIELVDEAAGEEGVRSGGDPWAEELGDQLVLGWVEGVAGGRIQLAVGHRRAS